jgi:hypothetical protein
MPLDIGLAPINEFINQLGKEEAPRDLPANNRDRSESKMFSSQETPPQDEVVAFTAPPQAMLTPGTLVGAPNERWDNGPLLHGRGHLGGTRGPVDSLELYHGILARQ